MNDDLWSGIPDPNYRPNRAARRRAIKRLDRSLRIGMFGFGGKHRRKQLRGKVKPS